MNSDIEIVTCQYFIITDKLLALKYQTYIINNLPKKL